MSDWLGEMALRHAERLASAGKFDQAHEVLKDLHSTEAKIEHRSTELRDLVRDSLRIQLAEGFPDRSKCPRRLGDKVELRSLRMKPFDVYVWEQLDGATSIEDLIDIIPQNEIETLRTLRRLVEQGLAVIR